MTTTDIPRATRYEEPIIERQSIEECTVFVLTASGNLFRYIILHQGESFLVEISTEIGARIFELDNLHLDSESDTPTVMYTHTGVYNTDNSISAIHEISEWHIEDHNILYRVYAISNKEDPIHKLFWFYRTVGSIIEFMLLSKDFNKVLRYVPNTIDDSAVLSVLTHLSKAYLSKFSDHVNRVSLEDEPSFYEYITDLGVNPNFILEINDLVEGLDEYRYKSIIAPILFPDDYLLLDGVQPSDSLQLSVKTARDFRDLFYKCDSKVLFMELINGIANVVRILRKSTYQLNPQQVVAFNSLADTIVYGKLEPGLAKKYLDGIIFKSLNGSQLVSADFDVLVTLQELQPNLYEEDFEL